VGEGPLRRELEHLAEQLGLKDNVRFTGQLVREDLEKEYRASDVFVLPSSGEGFGIVYLEAWQHGLPVIAGNRGAATELISPYVNGLLVDPDSPEDIAGAILSLLRHPENGRRMGMNGHRLVVEKYNHSRFCDELRRLLQE
jgi:phosphatidylinositol alpha-1,6-mannosyltransferase